MNQVLMKIDVNNDELKKFTHQFLKVRYNHASKKWNISGKVTLKLLQKEIMHRSKLRNKFLKDKTQEYQDACDKQRNL